MLLGGCGVVEPEAELRELIAEAEEAAESRNTGYFRALLSDNYVDRRGQRKADIIDLIRGYFFVHSSVEVLNRVEAISLEGEDAAEVILNTALVGQAQGRSLLGIDGEYYRLELELVREGNDWRIIGADWGRSSQ